MARLQLRNITCTKKQDSISPDQPYIMLNGTKVYSGTGFKKNDSRNLQTTEPFQFSNLVRMELYEGDRGSRDDFLGEATIDDTPRGQKSVRFNERAGADYEIFYEVLED